MSAATINRDRWQEREEEKRNDRIREIYSSGSYTYRAIGRMFKISGQRVSQIIKKGKNGENKIKEN